ncbi:MAG TPA: hypothetical protein VGQ57_02020, partial [Polyangiaceae bacterium]|jgi:hypothetical protein|nr:hypothetical protein [Polyangiaceae bacterium]
VRGYGDLCLFDLYHQTLVSGVCELENLAQTEYILLVDGGRRIRVQDPTSDLCLALTESSEANGDIAVTFVACNACAAVYPGCDFEFTAEGQLAIDGHCLALPSSDGAAPAWSAPEIGTIEIAACSAERRMAWSLAGNLLGGSDVFDYYGRTE